MAIEKISNSSIRVNDHLLELFDTREPDVFDVMNAANNIQLQANGPRELRDSIVQLSHTVGLTRFDPTHAAYNQVPRFIDLASRAAREKAQSYRNFRVGASACAFDDEGGRVGYFFGANYKPSPESDKYCAELDIVKKVRSAQFNRIIALAVFGPSEFTDVDSFPSPTLHPCGVCRDMLTNDSLFVDNPLIVTSNKEGDIELFLKNELLSLHAA